MPIIIIAILIIYALVSSFLSAFDQILTLGFLPNGIHHAGHGLFDGNLHGHTYIPVIGIMMNYLAAIFVNLVDFSLWFVTFIPEMSGLADFVYSSPDFERMYGFVSHRSFFTHSILNPIFLAGLVGIILTKLIAKKHKETGMFLQAVLVMILMTIPCHLLSDTMPQNWQGSAYVNFKIFGLTLLPTSEFGSVLWLYFNSIFGIGLIVKTSDLSSGKSAG